MAILTLIATYPKKFKNVNGAKKKGFSYMQERDFYCCKVKYMHRKYIWTGICSTEQYEVEMYIAKC